MNGPFEASPELAAEGRFQGLTRLGFAARGLLYIVIGLLVIRTGRTEDLTGALEYLGDGTGRMLLLALSAGLLVYGLWRLSDMAFGIEHPGSDRKALAKRGAAGLIGAIYLYLGYKAVLVFLAGRAGESTPREQADTILDLPGGAAVLFAVALGLAVAGAYQLVTARNCHFMHRLREGAGQLEWIKWMGRLGYAARGIVFLTAALLIARAAIEHQATEAGSMEQALDTLRGPLLYAVAGGLILFGLFSLVEARYRRIHRPPIERIGQKVREKVAP